MSTGLYVTLYLAGNLIIAGKRAIDRVNLVRQLYLGFSGWIYFIDGSGQGKNPFYQGLGTRFSLVYES